MSIQKQLTFSIYSSFFHVVRPEILTKDWFYWRQVFSHHDVRGSKEELTDKKALEMYKNGPGVVLAEMDFKKGRNDKSVQKVYALSLDIDSGTDEEIFAALQKIRQYEWVAYTTYRHGLDDQTKIRVIIPLDEPIKTVDFPVAWHGLYHMTNAINDRKTKNPSRLLFLPTTFDKQVSWSHYNRSPENRFLALNDLVNIPVESVEELTDRNPVEYEQALQALRYVRKDSPYKHAATQLLNREPYAKPGERHNVNLGLTMLLATRTEKNPLNRSTIRAVFMPSLILMKEIDDSTPGVDEIYKAYTDALQKRTDARKAKQLGSEKTGYTDEELRKIAAACGISTHKRRITDIQHDLKDRWIITNTANYYFLQSDGSYAGPFGKDDAPLGAKKILAKAPIELIQTTANGFKPRPLSDLVYEYGQAASKVVADLTIDKSYFDPRTVTIKEAIAPLRDLSPLYNPKIDSWLRYFSLTEDVYEKLCNWLACVPDLNKMLCAIYLRGYPGSGKTIFSEGIASLWAGTSADIDKILGNFNEELCRCPVVLGDEAIPLKWKGTPTSTKLRTEIARTVRPLSRKYKGPAEIHGCIRLILTANNDDLLGQDGSTTQDDVSAVAQRFLYIYSPKKAADYLATLSQAEKDSWRRELFARHILYLAKHRQVVPGGRFWVEGSLSEITDMMLSSSSWNSRVCEWLVMYLMAPRIVDSQNHGLIRRVDGDLLCNTQAITDHWELFFPNTRVEPETKHIAQSLRALARGEVHLEWKGKKVRYWRIDPLALLAWVNRHAKGDPETILEAIATDSPKENS